MPEASPLRIARSVRYAPPRNWKTNFLINDSCYQISVAWQLQYILHMRPERCIEQNFSCVITDSFIHKMRYYITFSKKKTKNLHTLKTGFPTETKYGVKWSPVEAANLPHSYDGIIPTNFRDIWVARTILPSEPYPLSPTSCDREKLSLSHGIIKDKHIAWIKRKSAKK